MKIHKKGLLIITVILSVILAACGGNSDKSSTDGGKSGDKQIVMELNTSGTEDSAVGPALKKFAEELDELTDGAFKINIHYSNGLGGERESIEMMEINSLHMATASTGPLGNWVKEFNVFDLPFLLENYEHAFAVLDGEIGDELAALLEEKAKVKILGYWNNGFRQPTNSKRELKHVSDAKGMKHRVQENEVQIDTWKAFGADPTPVSYPELYSSLQQGVVDGQSNPLNTTQLTKMYEVQSYATILNDVYSPYPLMISKEFFDSLSEEHQEAIQQAADAALSVAREESLKLEDEAYDALIEEGMVITDDPDRQSFIDAVQPVYEKWAPELGEELVDRIRNFEY